MTPKQIGDEWFVHYRLCHEDLVAGPFKTNCEAWRWIDRFTGQPISPAEKKSEWIAAKIIGGGA